MKKIILSVLFICLILFSAKSQSLNTTDTAWKKQTDTIYVKIHKDPRIDLLVNKQIQINEETSRDARRIVKGFRILVINTSKREDAISAKSTVYTYFPELKSYLLYKSPNYQLKVGNFKERKDAEDYLRKIQKYFSRSIFIMNDIIEMKLEGE